MENREELFYEKGYYSFCGYYDDSNYIDRFCRIKNPCVITGGAIMEDAKWILCPVCKNKTRIMIREDTELKKSPLYCPKCRKESFRKPNDCNLRLTRFKVRVGGTQPCKQVLSLSKILVGCTFGKRCANIKYDDRKSAIIVRQKVKDYFNSIL